MTQDSPAPSSAPNVTLRPYHFQAGRAWRNFWLPVAFAFSCTVYGFAFALLAPNLMGLLALPIAILAAMVIWALPDTISAPTGPIQPLFFAFFAALVMWPNYLAIALPGLPWITLIRLIGFPLAALTLISASMSSSFRSALAEILASASVIWKMVALFVALQLVTLAFSKQVGYSTQVVLISQINCTLIFFVSCYVFSNKDRVTYWSYLIWAMAISVSLIGVLEHQEGRVPWAGHVPSFLKVNDPLIGLILTGGSRAGIHRVQATFSTSLGLSEYLALAAPFIIHFMIAGTRLLVRLAAAATLPLVLYAILITESRLGVVGVLLGSLTYLLLWAALRWRRDSKSVIGPAVALAYPLIFTLAIMSTFFIHRLHAAVWGNGVQDESNAGRAEEWALAIPKVLHNPFGYGAGTGGGVLNYLEADGRPTIDSYYISVVLEYGILGLILYYGAICYGIYLCAKLLMTNSGRDAEQSFLIPITASMVTFLFTKSVLSEVDNNPIVFALMGMVVALVHRSRASTGGVNARRPPPVHAGFSTP